VGLGPDRTAADAPEVDNVADEINRVGLALLQKIEKEIGLRRPRSQMHVRDEQRAVIGHAQPFRAKPKLLSTSRAGP
jgi:hypothetical protein